MIKRLTKHGKGLALVIDRSILELLEINAKTPLSVTTEGKRLVVSPVPDGKRKKLFQDALEKVNRRYGPALKRLAECFIGPASLQLRKRRSRMRRAVCCPTNSEKGELFGRTCSWP